MRLARAAQEPGSDVRLARAAQEFTARRSRYSDRERAAVAATPSALVGSDESVVAGADGADLERAELLALIRRQQATIRDQRRNVDAAVAETLRAAEELATGTLCAAAEEDAALAAATAREVAELKAQLAEERPRAQRLEAELAVVTGELIATRSELGVAVSQLALLRAREHFHLFGTQQIT